MFGCIYALKCPEYRLPTGFSYVKFVAVCTFYFIKAIIKAIINFLLCLLYLIDCCSFCRLFIYLYLLQVWFFILLFMLVKVTTRFCIIAVIDIFIISKF